MLGKLRESQTEVLAARYSTEQYWVRNPVLEPLHAKVTPSP